MADRAWVPNIYGSDYSDNDSFDFADFFSPWHSKIKGTDSDNDIFAKKGNDIVYAYGGNDYIDGGSGNDQLYGGTGNDTIDAGEGSDVIYGENGNDFITGGGGNDNLSGGAGNDILIGSSGADRFIYDTSRLFLSSDVGVDNIIDFKWQEGDKIVLDKDTFTGLRSLAGTGFNVSSDFTRVSSDAAAATSSALIVYNSTNGKLFYNANGSTGGFYNPDSSGLVRGGHFATLSDTPFLIGTDFIIQ